MITLLLFFTNTNCFSQVEVEQTGSKISIDNAQAALDFHNQAREEVGVSKLV